MDRGDIEALGGKVQDFLRELSDSYVVEADAYDLVFECFVTIDGKTYCVSVEPDDRCASANHPELEGD